MIHLPSDPFGGCLNGSKFFMVKVSMEEIKMKSRKILSLILAALMAAAMIPTSFAADTAADAAKEDTAVTDAAAPAADAEKTDEAAPAEEKAEAPAEEKTEAPAEDAEKTEEPAAETEAPAETPAEDAAEAETPAAPVVEKKDAKLIANAVLVNGEKVAFDAYTIDGYNYFKLRDVAAALTGTASNFDVQWDAEKFCIALTTAKAYEKIEGDLAAGKGEAAVVATSTTMGVTLNGEAVELKGYAIGGNTYFQLRDLGEKLGFVVDWSAAEKVVVLNSSDYVAPAEEEKPAEETPAETAASDEKAESSDDAAKTDAPAETEAEKTEEPAAETEAPAAETDAPAADAKAE